MSDRKIEQMVHNPIDKQAGAEPPRPAITIGEKASGAGNKPPEPKK